MDTIKRNWVGIAAAAGLTALSFAILYKLTKSSTTEVQVNNKLYKEIID
jgi:hypothetical protein